jgi:hypothetical protein
MSLFPDWINPNGDNVDNGVIQSNPLEILSMLGYRKYQITDNLAALVRQDLWPYEVERVADIRTELTDLDAQIKEGLSDSAVTQTCKTSMNWAAHIKMLRQQSHSLLLELARIYDIDLAESKYASYLGRVTYSTQYQ